MQPCAECQAKPAAHVVIDVCVSLPYNHNHTAICELPHVSTRRTSDLSRPIHHVSIHTEIAKNNLQAGWTFCAYNFALGDGECIPRFVLTDINQFMEIHFVLTQCYKEPFRRYVTLPPPPTAVCNT